LASHQIAAVAAPTCRFTHLHSFSASYRRGFTIFPIKSFVGALPSVARQHPGVSFGLLALVLLDQYTWMDQQRQLR